MGDCGAGLMLIARTLAPGEKIREPGVWDIPSDVYHGQPCDGPSVSSSGLRTLVSKSPKHFFAGWSGNRDRKEEKESEALILGRCAHALLLDQADFDANFVRRPPQWSDWRKAEAREWKKKQTEVLKKTVYDDKIQEAVEGMRAALAVEPVVANAGVLNGEVERSLIWKDETTGLWLKARPDVIPTDSNNVVDLKTTTSVDSEEIGKTIFKWKYHMQAALTGMGFRAVLGRKMKGFGLLFIEKEFPHCISLEQIMDEDLARGESLVRAAIDTVAQCLKTGEWPGPAGTISDAKWAQIPKWAVDREENRLAALQMEIAS